MDYRFQFRRTKPAPEELSEQARIETDRVRRMRGLSYGMAIPISLLAGPIGGYFLGEMLDHHFHNEIWVPLLIVLGTAAGFKMVIDMLIRLGKT